MILSTDDIANYAPSITLTGVQLTAAIALAQGHVEGTRGARRKLELAEYKEIHNIRLAAQTCRLELFPVVSITKVEGRIANVRGGYGRQTGVTQWSEIETDNYIYDEETQQLNLSPSYVTQITSGFGFHFPMGNRANFSTDVRITYQAGYDFTDDTNTDVVIIKSIMGQIMDYQRNSFVNQGISQVRVDDEVAYAFRQPTQNNNSMVQAGFGQIPDGFLEPLYQYRPKSSSTIRG